MVEQADLIALFIANSLGSVRGFSEFLTDFVEAIRFLCEYLGQFSERIAEGMMIYAFSEV